MRCGRTVSESRSVGTFAAVQTAAITLSPLVGGLPATWRTFSRARSTPWDTRDVPAMAASLVAGLVLASFGVLCHSAAFWTGRADEAGSFGTMILVSFALYPPGIFAGPARVMLFVGIPAGLMSWLPAELVLRWDAGRAGALLLGVAAFAGAALLAWTRGLRRYESGNLTQAAGE